MNTIIENLKDKTYVRAFGLMTSEEQEYIKKAGERNCVCYTLGWEQAHFTKPYNGNTYAIKPDYRTEPEYRDLEVVDIANLLGVKDKGVFSPLYKLSSLPNFEGFKVDENPIPTDYVARNISKGKTVYARFRSKP